MNMKVFIVDNSTVVIGRLRSLLADVKDVEIIGTAQTSIEAIENINVSHPDVVILDVQLGEGSGFKVLESLGATTHSPIVIMFTNLPTMHHYQKCKTLGANYFFDKSNEFEALRQTVQSLSEKFLYQHTFH